MRTLFLTSHSRIFRPSRSQRDPRTLLAFSLPPLRSLHLPLTFSRHPVPQPPFHSVLPLSPLPSGHRHNTVTRYPFHSHLQVGPVHLPRAPFLSLKHPLRDTDPTRPWISSHLLALGHLLLPSQPLLRRPPYLPRQFINEVLLPLLFLPLPQAPDDKLCMTAYVKSRCSPPQRRLHLVWMERPRE